MFCLYHWSGYYLLSLSIFILEYSERLSYPHFWENVLWDASSLKIHDHLMMLQARRWKREGTGDMPPPPPTLFLKSYLARNAVVEIRFCVILQGIQNIFGLATHRISSRAPCYKKVEDGHLLLRFFAAVFSTILCLLFFLVLS